MSVGFRKSLFGFNTDDVIEYVQKLHSSFTEKEAKLGAQISELENKIESLCARQEALKSEKAKLQEVIDAYDSKKAEMDRLGENIGKLYLVAKSNSETVMTNAEESSKEAFMQAERNVSAIEETHLALDTLKNNIRETAERFENELSALMSSLQSTKEKLSQGKAENEKAQEEFASLLEAISK